MLMESVPMQQIYNRWANDFNWVVSPSNHLTQVQFEYIPNYAFECNRFSSHFFSDG